MVSFYDISSLGDNYHRLSCICNFFTDDSSLFGNSPSGKAEDSESLITGSIPVFPIARFRVCFLASFRKFRFSIGFCYLQFFDFTNTEFP